MAIEEKPPAPAVQPAVPRDASRTLFLCGDVMTGRGVDQVLPRSCPPRLYEPVVKSAAEYVALAERAHGPIPRPVPHDYVWGEALAILAHERPDATIVNLETAITTSEEAAAKRVNYRMHPANVPVLTGAGIDCCALANNHVLDWGERGLLETLDTLAAAGIRFAGAGRTLEAARAPAVLTAGTGGRVLVFGFGVSDSGIPGTWAAGPAKPGVHLLPDLSIATAERIAGLVRDYKRADDIAVASIHWGANWGFQVPGAHRLFAHALIDRVGIDIVHGHSSHHPKAAEVYRGRPILYGCGDFLDDYEGIPGHEAFRADLVLMYFLTLSPKTGQAIRFRMMPLRLRNFRLVRPSPPERAWLARTLGRQCRVFGHRVELRDEALTLELP
jgi:poly-gamma-glutamate capsule biosynthesis protein CapA/YwtB (metallophosphatase superfamily)